MVWLISFHLVGRASDVKIIENWKFLETLVIRTLILDDRGFKHVEHGGIKLHVPPSFAVGPKLSREQVLQVKIIAGLWMHLGSHLIVNGYLTKLIACFLLCLNGMVLS